MDRKNIGLSNTLMTIIIIVVVIIAGVGVAALGGAFNSAPAEVNPVTVYIDGVKQTGNYSEPQTLTWPETAIAGWTYDVNFTVTNNMEENVRVTLIVDGPAVLSWAKNGSDIAPTDSVAAPLTVTDYAQGTYTWMVKTSNAPAVSPTPNASPTPTPSATPVPTPVANALQFTINADTGVKNITVTKNAEKPFVLIADQLPKTYLFTAGDKFKFEIALEQDYTFNGWDFNDGTTPNMNNPLIVIKTGNFTVTADIIAPQGVT